MGATTARSARSETRTPPRIDPIYTGGHPDQFSVLLDRVRQLAPQSQLDISARLGFVEYRSGFRYPLTVHFTDGGPEGTEHTLAYARFLPNPDKNDFAQELVVNVDRFIEHPSAFDPVFVHEMTHAVLNDAVGGEASQRFPHWVQEGLALHIAGQGDDRVKKAASQYPGFAARELAQDLEGPYQAKAYPQYYLGIQYILEKGGINALQSFVRTLLAGKSTSEAIQESLSTDWTTFQKEVREYSARVFDSAAEHSFGRVP